MEIIYACEEHIDQAMDEVINEKETFPVFSYHRCIRSVNFYTISCKKTKHFRYST